MPNIRNQEVDHTYLSVDTAERRGFFHRDYLAHCFRWSHVVKHCFGLKEIRLLDIGCGKELPLLKTLYTSKKAPTKYVGVDVRPLEIPKDLLSIKEKTEIALISNDFALLDDIIKPGFNVVACFEVLEHVEPDHAFRILKKIRSLADTADIFISTPNYDPHVGAADNHVSEYSYQAFKEMLKKSGFNVIKSFGTFASIKDYKAQVEKDGLTDLFEKLRAYYDTNVLATIFAPLYPEFSRNVLWHVRKADAEQLDLFPDDLLDQKHCSSDKWISFCKEVLK